MPFIDVANQQGKLLVKLNKNYNSFKKILVAIITYLIYFPLLLTYRLFAKAQNDQ